MANRINILLTITAFNLAVSVAAYAENRTFTLDYCQTLAAANYEPLKLAQEEIDVKCAKAIEAARALWPNLSVKGEFTRGAAIVELGTPGFREGSYGLQLSHILFHGGKLWATYQQADINKKIAECKYQKEMLNMQYQLAQAYWNLVRLYSNLDNYKQSYTDISHYLRMAQKLFKDGVINKRHLIATQARKNSAAYQIQSTRADIDKFRWELAAAVGLDQPVTGAPETKLEYQTFEISLEECLQKALNNNPDLQIQILSLKASEYEKTVHYSQDWPKIELTGFYGRSGGAYDSESLELTEDYNISLKLTQNIAWNSLVLSGIEQKTSPKLGQSSRTESRTAAAALNILDGYKSAAEKKESHWQYQQALYDQKKARRTVVTEVREAYFNYRKGQSQVENARLEVDLAKREWSIQKIHLRDDKSSIADVAEARNKYATALANLNEAKVFYLLALAALDKAIGEPLFSPGCRSSVKRRKKSD